jgi:uncharacterized protein YndB with AHSA1/START domain
MKEFTTTAAIRATPESVWAILTDGPGYTHWNPEISRIDGRIALGEKIKAHVVLHGGKVQQVTVRVTALEPPRRMVWTAGLPLGLFTGRRTFSVTPRDGGDGRIHDAGAAQRTARALDREIPRQSPARHRRARRGAQDMGGERT